MIYYPDSKKIQKRRLVEFVPEVRTEADMIMIDDDYNDLEVMNNLRESGKDPEVNLQSSQEQVTVKELEVCKNQTQIDKDKPE